MNGLSIADLVTVSGDVHHIFPKGYLMKMELRTEDVIIKLPTILT